MIDLDKYIFCNIFPRQLMYLSIYMFWVIRSITCFFFSQYNCENVAPNGFYLFIFITLELWKIVNSASLLTGEIRSYAMKEKNR